MLSVKNPDRTWCSIGNDKPPPGVHTEYSYSIINMYKFLGKLNGLCSRILKFVGIELRRNYFYDIFCIPDIFWGWIPLTIIKGLRLIKRYDIDVIYVSSPPFSSAVVGVLLKLITGKPLILDYRDASGRLIFHQLPKFKKRIDEFIEENLLQSSDIFIVICKDAKRAYMQRYPWIKSKIFVIPNGFDPESMPQEKSISKYSKFTIIYAGRYFYPCYERNSNPLFEALAILSKMKIISKNNFQLLFYGTETNEIGYISRKYCVEDLVIINSRISYEDVLKVTLMSHLQFLRNPEFTIVTKLYDSIPLNIPLLATIPNGEAEETIRKYSPSSYIITNGSAQDVAKAILETIQRYIRNNIKDNKVDDFLEHFSRENLTLNFMKIVEENIPLQRGSS